MTASNHGIPFCANNALVLGTAQFGLLYGVANRSGKPDQDTVVDIVRTAWDNGITEIDTAQAYGDSEEVLGRVLHELGLAGRIRIISKFHPHLNHLDYSCLSESLARTLHQLGIPSIDGMMLHREELLSLWNQGLSTNCRDLIRSGRVREIGVSVYSPEKAHEALRTDGIDFVQIPSNILDRRFERANIFNQAVALGKKLYVRSVYLQGLLLMAPHDIPAELISARPVLETLQCLADSWNLTRQEICLGYFREEMPGARLVIGAETPEQIRDTVMAWKNGVPRELADQIRALFSNVGEDILNPHLWPPLRRQADVYFTENGEAKP
jgi:aryl-alcohol dehydrogenase-like predicted oxidoreductase